MSAVIENCDDQSTDNENIQFNTLCILVYVIF